MVDFKGSIQWLHYQKKAFERGTWGSRCYFYNLLLPKPFCLLFLIFIWIASVLCFLAEVRSKIQSNNFEDQPFNSSLAALSCEAFKDLQTLYNSNIVSPVKLDRILISLQDVCKYLGVNVSTKCYFNHQSLMTLYYTWSEQTKNNW